MSWFNKETGLSTLGKEFTIKVDLLAYKMTCGSLHKDISFQRFVMITVHNHQLKPRGVVVSRLVCLTFFEKSLFKSCLTLNSHSASLHTEVQMGTNKLMQGVILQ